jgi:hypothetical protein
MTKEIRRNVWAKFLKQFNADNQYRHIILHIMDNENERRISVDDNPFFGMSLRKKGRAIDGIQLFAGQADSENVTQPVAIIDNPARIMVEKDNKGYDRQVTVLSNDGPELRIELGQKNDWTTDELIRKVAYSIYEKRGYGHGWDIDDWLTAEDRIKNTELLFVK